MNNSFEHLRNINIVARRALPQHLTSVPRQSACVRGIEPSLLTNRELELALQTADHITEQATSLAEALEQLAYLFATSLPIAYCRLLLVAEDGQSLIVRAAHSVTAGLHWEPQLGKPVPFSQLPDGTRLSRMTYSLVGSCRGPLAQQQLRSYAATLGLQEPLRLLLLVPLRIEGQLLGVLELGELERDQATQLDADKVNAAIMNARRLAVPIDQLQRRETIQADRPATHCAGQLWIERREGEEIMNNHHDLVIVDPAVTAKVTAEIAELRAEDPPRRIIVQTDMPEWQQARAAFAIDASDYLPKNQDAAQLLPANGEMRRKEAMSNPKILC
jgi:GAF domain-containing protein